MPGDVLRLLQAIRRCHVDDVARECKLLSPSALNDMYDASGRSSDRGASQTLLAYTLDVLFQSIDDGDARASLSSILHVLLCSGSIAHAPLRPHSDSSLMSAISLRVSMPGEQQRAAAYGEVLLRLLHAPGAAIAVADVALWSALGSGPVLAAMLVACDAAPGSSSALNDAVATPFGLHTPLTAAVASGSEECVALLLCAGVDVNASGGGRETPLTAAIATCAEPLVSALLTAGADANAVRPDGSRSPPLCVLCAACAVEPEAGVSMLRDLLHAGARVDTVDVFGMSPLHVAAVNSQLWALPVLLDAGAGRDAKELDRLCDVLGIMLGPEQYETGLTRARVHVHRMLTWYRRRRLLLFRVWTPVARPAAAAPSTDAPVCVDVMMRH